MPDDQQNNDQPQLQPEQQSPPPEAEMPRPLDEPALEQNETPQSSYDTPFSPEPTAETSEPDQVPEAPLVDQPMEQSTPPDSAYVNPSELPPAQSFPSYPPDPNQYDSTTPIGSHQPEQSEKKKSGRKKGLIAAIIAIIVAVLLIGGGAAGYFLWYQNPEKVVMDSFVKTINAETGTYAGTVEINNKSLDLTLAIDGRLNKDGTANTMTATITPKNTGVDMGEMTVSGEAIILADTLYIKMNDLQDVYAELRDSLVQSLTEGYAEQGLTLTSEQIAAMKDQVDNMYKPIVEKMSDQWIEIAPSDIDDTTDSETNEFSCVADAFKKVSADGALPSDIAQTYKDNTFVVITEELGTKDGSLGYVLTLDEAKAKAFGEAIEETQLAKDIRTCTGDDAAIATDDEISFKDQRFELWVDQWTHEPTRIVAQVTTTESTAFATTTEESATTFSIDMTTELNASVEIKVPADAKSLEDVFDLDDSSPVEQLFGA